MTEPIRYADEVFRGMHGDSFDDVVAQALTRRKQAMAEVNVFVEFDGVRVMVFTPDVFGDVLVRWEAERRRNMQTVLSSQVAGAGGIALFPGDDVSVISTLSSEEKQWVDTAILLRLSQLAEISTSIDLPDHALAEHERSLHAQMASLETARSKLGLA